MKDYSQQPNLLTHRGYMMRFWYYAAAHNQARDPMRQGWMAVERELMQVHRCRRYLNYHSFRTGKHKNPERVRAKSE